MTSLRELFQSLGLRLLVLLFLTICAVLAVYAFFDFRTTRDRFLDYVSTEVRRSSELIRRATHDGMLLNRKHEVQNVIERLAEGPEVAAIRVFDKAGTIVLSSDRGEVGQRIAVESVPCTSCHEPWAPLADGLLETSRRLPGTDGREVLRHLSMIPNEPACAAGGCHASPSEQKMLGVLNVEMSMSPLATSLRSAQRQLLWTALALTLLIGSAASVFIRLLVYRPIARLHEGTRRIAGGELDTRIEVRGRHELARLAAAFNGMAEDLSRARKELTAWSQTLEDKVVEKTEELRRAQRQVLHMEKMASLGKLSATVAHELNNPLAGVLTYARLVERELEEQPIDGVVRAELVRYLGLVQKECGRCGDIVKNLLLFARRSGAEMSPVDLNEILDRSLMLVRHHLEISGVTLTSEPLAGDSEIVADAGQLQQALVALLVNAVEAMAGGGELAVGLEGDAEEVRISVTDTGTGISADDMPNIFEPFYSTKNGESGVGLGLAVVYGIVHRHGGAIDVDSRPGRGTTFRVRLPRRPRAAAEPAAENAAVATPGP